MRRISVLESTEYYSVVHVLYPALVKVELHLTCDLHGGRYCAVRIECHTSEEPPLACMRVPAVWFTNLTRGLTLAPQLCSMNANNVEGQPLVVIQAGDTRLHSMTSVQVVNTTVHDAPSDSNQSCQSISPSKLLLSDTTCSKSSSDRQSPPKSAKRKRAEAILERKYAQRAKGGPAREMIGLSSRHEDVGACSSSERSRCNL